MAEMPASEFFFWTDKSTFITLIRYVITCFLNTFESLKVWNFFLLRGYLCNNVVEIANLIFIGGSKVISLNYIKYLAKLLHASPDTKRLIFIQM